MVFGSVFAGHRLGAAVAACGAGRGRTLVMTYNPALYTAGPACLAAAAIIMLVRRPAARAAA